MITSFFLLTCVVASEDLVHRLPPAAEVVVLLEELRGDGDARVPRGGHDAAHFRRRRRFRRGVVYCNFGEVELQRRCGLHGVMAPDHHDAVPPPPAASASAAAAAAAAAVTPPFLALATTTTTAARVHVHLLKQRVRPPLLPTRQRVDERVGEKAGAALGLVHDEHGETGGGVVSGGRKDDGPLRAEGKKADDEGHPH